MKCLFQKLSLGILLAMLCLMASGKLFAGGRPTATPTCVIPNWTGNVVQSWTGATGTMSGPGGDWKTGGTTGSAAWVTSSDTSYQSCGQNGCDDFVFTNTDSYTTDYKLEGNVSVSSSNHNTFFVTIFGPSGIVDDSCGNSTEEWSMPTGSGENSWVNEDDGSNAAASARDWTLGTGTYTIQIAGDEYDTVLNSISILQNPTAPTATSTPSPTPLAATGTGLCEQAYSNMSLSGTVQYQTTNQQVADVWASGPGGGIPANNFSVQWTGDIQIPQPGQYQFSLYSDDGARMWIDGVEVVNNWIDQSATTSTASTVASYTAGMHSIIVQYYQDTGAAVCYLNWESTNISWQVVPKNELYGTGCTVASPTMTPTSGGAPVATPTWTPTITNTVTPVYQGLSETAWLSGLEYIPFPVETTSSNFYDLSAPFQTAASNGQPKNTARWKIILCGVSSTAAMTFNGQVSIETRIGYYGVTCTTGYYNPADYTNATTMTLPPRPSNLSTSYFWIDNEAVPVTEQFDAMGDPREVPYRDMMGLPAGETYANNYDWFFMNIASTTFPTAEKNANAYYAPFIPDAQFDQYDPGGGGGPHADVPKLFALWRNGITHSESIYTSMAGYDSYYIGLGGEIGGDTSNNMNGGVLTNDSPWGGSSGSSYNYNEIIGNGTQSPGMALVADTQSPHVWNAMPWLGELWPDSAYWSDWYNQSTATTAVTWGNLRNKSDSGTWERDFWTNCGNDATGVPYQFTFTTALARNAGTGCATMLDGNGGSSTYNHSTNGINATVGNDGNVMSVDYNFALDSPFAVTRPWGLNMGGNTPPEWSMVPYSTERTTLGVFSATTVPASTWGFYNYDGASDPVNDKSSAAIRVYDPTGPAVGWYIVNGLEPATQSGIDFLAQFALLTCVRTFQDAGTPTMDGSSAWSTANIVSGNAYRIEPIPYVEITSPVVGQDVLGDTSITITWNERYARWDDHKYTENYPCLDNSNGYNPQSQAPCAPQDPNNPDQPTNEWHDPQPLTYNVLYSTNAGSTYFSAITPGETATAGTLLGGADALTFPTGQYTHTYNWDVSALPAGNKVFMVECFRTNLPQHYAYHTIALDTQ